jgi:glycosyltransferase involved in cell wall biosynthesis
MLTVLITTYNRPNLLLNLLKDLQEQAEERINVCVYDDASTEDYSEVQAFLKANKWKWSAEEENHGKTRHGEFIGKVFADQRSKRRKGPFLFLPDDVRLRPGFFAKMAAAWDSIEDPNKVCLRVLVSEARRHASNWNGQVPKQVNDLVDEVGFFDGGALLSLDFLETLDYGVPMVDSRVSLNPQMSSGMGKAVSEFLHKKGKRMYRVRDSLVTHVVAKSQMHPELRLRDSATAEGDSLPMRYTDRVHAAIATMPTRVHFLEKAVSSLLPQVEHLYIYLNGHLTVPSFLHDPKITVARSEEHGDLTDSGKFFWADKVSGYYFTCDDDIEYPADYVEKMVSHIEARERKAIVTVHGRVLPDKMPIASYYRDRRIDLLHNQHSQATDKVVHIGGTGVMAFHTSSVKVSVEEFKAPRMADVWMAVVANAQSVPIVCVRRPKGWLNLLPSEGIFVEDKNLDRTQTDVVNREEWPGTTRRTDPLFASMRPVPRISNKHSWAKEAKVRSNLAVIFPEWNSRDVAKHNAALVKFVKQMVSQHLQPGGTVLDFGCGWGRWKPVLAPYGTYAGVDISAEITALRPTEGVRTIRSVEEVGEFRSLFIFDVLRYMAPADIDALRKQVKRGTNIVIFEVEQRPRSLSFVQDQLPWVTEAGSLRIGGMLIKCFGGRVG